MSYLETAAKDPNSSADKAGLSMERLERQCWLSEDHKRLYLHAGIVDISGTQWNSCTEIPHGFKYH